MRKKGHQAGYFKKLMGALLGRDPAAEAAGLPEAELRSRVAALEMDLRERDKRIETIQREYAALNVARETDAAGRGQDQLERLFKKLAGGMSNLSALADYSEAGREVAIRDLVALIRGLEKELTRAGLERVGAAGQRTVFDTTVHQRMSGGTVSSGTPVTVRLPGYRMGKRVLLKAMVSAGEAKQTKD